MSITTKITARKLTNTFNNKGLSLLFSAVLGLSALGLVGCSSGGSSDPAPEVPVVDAKPTGYYTGSADVKDETGADQRLDDLQAMIYGNRFMAMSAAGAAGVTGATGSIVYDGTITDINGNDFTADVTIYVTNSDGQSISVSSTTVAGIITEGSQITGTFAGTGVWSGSFSFVYAQNNSEVSSIATIETAASDFWAGEIMSFQFLSFTVDKLGNAIHFDQPGDGVFGSCSLANSTILPIVNTRLYSVSFEFTGCSDINIEGKTYTGLATTKGADDILVLVFTGNGLAAATDYNLLTF